MGCPRCVWRDERAAELPRTARLCLLAAAFLAPLECLYLAIQDTLDGRLGNLKMTPLPDPPIRLSNVIGQSQVVERLRALVQHSEKRITPHLLIAGPEGSGKRTLVRAFANECGVNLVAVSAAALQRGADL